MGDLQSNERKLDEWRATEAEELAQIMAERYGLPYADLSKIALNTDALKLVPEAAAREAEAAAFKLVGRKIFLLVASPVNPKTDALIRDLTGKNFLPQLYLGSKRSLELAWERYREISKSLKTREGIIEISAEEIAVLVERLRNLEDLKKLLETEGAAALKEGVISSLLEIILAGGIQTQASDIHIEPQRETVRMRYRLDGVLHDISFFDFKLYERVLSRVKLVAGLKLNIQEAQDGRFSIEHGDEEIEIRVSVLPGAYGESIVLRLLNPQTIGFDLAELGVEPKLLAIIEDNIAKPNGMVLLTGPTGSGKTTTLYAFLRRINREDNKIITIEDPIEYHLRGINQTQVNPAKNYTFLSGLRSALRQDPDVIMVGEIRDKETAGVAINAALTGHLVFSTLHTNNAAGTLPRLIDLDVNPKILDSAINLAIAQRLVRRLCPDCREPASPGIEEKTLLEKTLEAIKRKRPELPRPEIKIWRPGPTGCARCHGIGYKGRIGVFEAILMDQKISRLLVANPSEREIKIAALDQGILDMRQDGILKVLTGITSLDELSRVVDIKEEFVEFVDTPRA